MDGGFSRRVLQTSAKQGSRQRCSPGIGRGNEHDARPCGSRHRNRADPRLSPKSAVPPRTAVVQTLAIRLLPVLGAWTDQVCSGRDRLRSDRASSSTSRKRSSPSLLVIRSSMSPCSAVVESVRLAAAPRRCLAPVRQGATGHVGDIADQPVAPLATTVGDVVAISPALASPDLMLEAQPPAQPQQCSRDPWKIRGVATTPCHLLDLSHFTLLSPRSRSHFFVFEKSPCLLPYLRPKDTSRRPIFSDPDL
jgi:hypothetical protein